MVAVYEVLPQVLWKKKFLKEQGICDQGDYHLPGQYKLNFNEKEWQAIKHQAHPAQGHLAFYVTDHA